MLFFQILCFRMGAYENELGAFNYSKVPMYVKLLMTLWTLGNKESFRGIGDRFGMYQGNTINCRVLLVSNIFRFNNKISR
jgi:hypothetical protein